MISTITGYNIYVESKYKEGNTKECTKVVIKTKPPVYNVKIYAVVGNKRTITILNFEFCKCKYMHVNQNTRICFPVTLSYISAQCLHSVNL